MLRENKEILDGDSLFDRIKRPVILNAEQTPLYGDIKMTGHEMGDFLLVPKELQGGLQVQPERKADLSFLQRGNEIVERDNLQSLREVWVNPDNGNQYQVTPQPVYNGPSNQTCRVALINGKTITACRDANGNWQIQP